MIIGRVLLIKQFTNQTIPNGVPTKVTHDLIEYDTIGGCVDNDDIVVPVGATWGCFGIGHIWDNNASGDRQGVVRRDGLHFRGGPQINGRAISMTTHDYTAWSADIPVTPGQRFYSEAQQSSGSGLVLKFSTGTWFAAKFYDDPAPAPAPPPGGIVYSAATPTATATPAAGYTYVDRSFTIPAGVMIAKLGLYSVNAATVAVKLVARVGSGVYDVLASEAFAHPGGGWADHTLSAPVTLPANGVYHAAFHLAAGNTAKFNQGVARAYYLGDASGPGVTFTEDSAGVPALRATG